MKLNQARTATRITALAGALAMTACTMASSDEPTVGDAENPGVAQQSVVAGIFITPGELATIPCGVGAGTIITGAPVPGGIVPGGVVPGQGLPTQDSMGLDQNPFGYGGQSPFGYGAPNPFGYGASTPLGYGGPEQGMLPTQELPGKGLPEQGNVGKGLPEQGNVGKGLPEQGNVGKGIPEQGPATFPTQESPGKGLPEQGNVGKGIPEQGTTFPTQEMPGKGVPEQGNVGKGLPEQGVPTQSLPEQSVPQQGVPGGIPTPGIGAQYGTACFDTAGPFICQRRGFLTGRFTGAFVQGRYVVVCVR